MARKAPPKGKGQAKRKSASAPRKAQTRGAAAPRKRKQASAAGQSAYQKRLAEYQRTHPNWRLDPHWKQKARGHTEREHVSRLQKWRDRAMAFAEQQARRFPGDLAKMAAENFAAFDARRKRLGEGDLANLMRVAANLAAERAEQPLDDKGRPEKLSAAQFRRAARGLLRPGINMETLADANGVPLEVFGYH